jgi:hypothetical protein
MTPLDWKMTPLHWRLVEVWQHSSLLNNLITWRKSQNKILFVATSTIKKIPENASLLESLHQQDKKYDGLVGRHRGRRLIVGTTLLALQWAYRIKVIELYRTGALPKSQTWKMLNCQPAGGHWVSSYFNEGFTGKRCWSPLCPWCYLREFDMHAERIRTMFMPDKKLREATVYLLKICPASARTLAAANQRILQIYIGNSVRRKLKTSAYRLMGYPYVVDKNKSASYGVRVGYFTNDNFGWGEFCRNVKVKDQVVKVHFENIPAIWIDHGIRHIWPYPVALLDAPCNTVVEYLKFRKHRRDYGVIQALNHK